MLCNEVEKHLKLNFVGPKDKISRRSAYMQVWETTGHKPQELEDLEPTIPQAGQDLWDIFWTIKTGEEISWSDFLAYSIFTGLELEPFEIEIIIAMNNTYNGYINDQYKTN